MQRFPWSEFMRAGLGVLRLSPRDFWQATPREIAAALSPGGGAGGIGRDGLDRLIQQFPDNP